MVRPKDCSLQISPKCPSPSPAQRDAIILALRRLVDVGDDSADELVLKASLDEGLSGAHVYSGKLTYTSGRTCRVVVKLDRSGRLADELECARLCAAAPNVAGVLAPSEVIGVDAEQEWAAILYVHAREPWPGSMRTLKTVVRENVSDPKGPQEALALLERVFGALHAQVHKLETGTIRAIRELEFYQQRWLSAVTLRVDDLDSTCFKLFANSQKGDPDPRQLDLSIGVVEDQDGNSFPIAEAIGENVRVGLLPLYPYGQRYVGTKQEHGEVRLEAPDALFRSLRRWATEELHIASVSGVLIETQQLAYARVLESAGLDPAATQWFLGDDVFANPLPNLLQNARRWRQNQSEVEAAFSHGDLHGGNVLSVGHDFVLIDLGLAGKGQPRWADSARLIGSLFRDALAPQLEPEQIAEVLVCAFQSPAEPVESPSARFLHGAFEAAVRAFGSGHPEARRELWIALHHFSWVALKWSAAEDLTSSEAHRRIVAMALLAAVSAGKVDEQALTIRRYQETQTLEDAHRLSEMIAARVRRGENIHEGLEFKAELRKIVRQLDDVTLTSLAKRSQALSAQCERIFASDWGDRDIDEVEALLSRLDRPLTTPEEVLLVDILLVGCSRRWSDRAFGVILRMCDSGNPEVAIEGYLAVYLLQGHPEAHLALARHPRLLNQFQRSLSRTSARSMRRIIDEIISSSFGYGGDLFQNLMDRLKVEGLHLAAVLRPFRAFEHSSEDNRHDELQPRLLEYIEASLSLSEIEKYLLAQSLSNLSHQQLTHLVQVFMTEQRRFAGLGLSPVERRLYVRSGSLLQLPEILDFGGLNFEAASRHMYLTLKDIVRDENEFLDRLYGELLLNGCALLRTLDSQCTDPGEELSWECLAEETTRRACELLLDWLRSGHPEALSLIDGLLEDVESLSQDLVRVDSDSELLEETYVSWNQSPSVRRVFSPEVFKKLLSAVLESAPERTSRQNVALASYMYGVVGDIDAAHKLYEKAIEADPSNANHLGTYAVFMKNAVGDMATAESLYERCIEANPNHANHLGNYALFMETVKDDVTTAESLYERCIEADPSHAHHLGNYALFMETVKDDVTTAESLYERCIEANPNHANHLGNYASFMKNVKGDMATAESLYERCIDADPHHANNLGNYANFMRNVKGEMDTAESLYERCIDADPHHANNLGNYAHFMWTVKGEVDTAESLYERCIEANPNGAYHLGSYALFMKKVKGDMATAESLYERCIEADPNDAHHLGNYAFFMATVKGEMANAESLYERCIEADPSHANHLGNFSGFLFALGQNEKAQELRLRCGQLPNLEEPLKLELAFYAYAHMPEERGRASAELERLLDAGVRSPGFDLSKNVERARQDGHPEIARVQAFSEQIASHAVVEDS